MIHAKSCGRIEGHSENSLSWTRCVFATFEHCSVSFRSSMECPAGVMDECGVAVILEMSMEFSKQDRMSIEKQSTSLAPHGLVWPGWLGSVNKRESAIYIIYIYTSIYIYTCMSCAYVLLSGWSIWGRNHFGTLFPEKWTCIFWKKEHFCIFSKMALQAKPLCPYKRYRNSVQNPSTDVPRCLI